MRTATIARGSVRVNSFVDGERLEAEINYITGQVCSVSVNIADRYFAFAQAGDLFAALCGAREILERDAVLLQVVGSLPNVYPSQLLRNTDHGRYAYKLTIPRTPDKPELVDIFESALNDAVLSSVHDQREWFWRWLASSRRGRIGAHSAR
jgi:hypothetical protein